MLLLPEAHCMHSRKGTTVIEFLVYLALFSFVAACSISWIVGYQQLSSGYQTKRAALINRCTSLDMIARDLQSAPSAADGWYSFLPHEIIWHTETDDIGWLFKDNSLYRCQGRYNAKKKSWTTKNSAIIAKPINKLVFSSTGQQSKKTISITITNAG